MFNIQLQIVHSNFEVYISEAHNAILRSPSNNIVTIEEGENSLRGGKYWSKAKTIYISIIFSPKNGWTTKNVFRFSPMLVELCVSEFSDLNFCEDYR